MRLLFDKLNIRLPGGPPPTPHSTDSKQKYASLVEDLELQIQQKSDGLYMPTPHILKTTRKIIELQDKVPMENRALDPSLQKKLNSLFQDDTPPSHKWSWSSFPSSIASGARNLASAVWNGFINGTFSSSKALGREYVEKLTADSSSDDLAEVKAPKKQALATKREQAIARVQIPTIAKKLEDLSSEVILGETNDLSPLRKELQKLLSAAKIADNEVLTSIKESLESLESSLNPENLERKEEVKADTPQAISRQLRKLTHFLGQGLSTMDFIKEEMVDMPLSPLEKAEVYKAELKDASKIKQELKCLLHSVKSLEETEEFQKRILEQIEKVDFAIATIVKDIATDCLSPEEGDDNDFLSDFGPNAPSHTSKNLKPSFDKAIQSSAKAVAKSCRKLFRAKPSITEEIPDLSSLRENLHSFTEKLSLSSYVDLKPLLHSFALLDISLDNKDLRGIEAFEEALNSDENQALGNIHYTMEHLDDLVYTPLSGNTSSLTPADYAEKLKILAVTRHSLKHLLALEEFPKEDLIRGIQVIDRALAFTLEITMKDCVKE